MSNTVDIVYEDNHLLIINKPAGMPSQLDLTEDACALDLAKDYIKHQYNKPGNVYAGLAHRIDRPVSGLLLLCKTSKSLSRMMEQFKKRMIKKTYLAVVDGQMSDEFLDLEDHLLKNSARNISKVVGPNIKGAKRAETTVAHVFSFGGHSLVKVYPRTGRSHQIRVQLAHAGLPIVGDVKYGGIRHSEKRAICLHSHELAFDHPVSKQALVIRSLPYQHHWLPYGQLLARVAN